MNSQETAFSPADYRDTIEHLLADTTFGGITPLPATDDRIAAFVAASGRGADTEIGSFPGQSPITIRALAKVAALAGCDPAHMRVLIPAFEILLDPAFPITLITESSASYFPLLIVNGPIRQELGINCRANLFGPGHRANAVIGRALWLGIVTFSSLKDTPDLSTLGTGYRYTAAIGEDEEYSQFPCLQETFNIPVGESYVTLLLAWQPGNVSNLCTPNPEHLLFCYSEELSTATRFEVPDVDVNPYALHPRALLFIAEEHRDYFNDAGWDVARMQSRMHELTRRRVGDVRASGYHNHPLLAGKGDDEIIPLFSSPKDFIIVGVGSGGGRTLVGGALFAMSRPALDSSLVYTPLPRPAKAPTTLEDFVDVVQYYMDNGQTDGWPVLLPDARGIAEFIEATGRDGTEELGISPWRNSQVTIKDVAVCGYMAGCEKRAMPLLAAMFEFMFHPTNDQGVGGMAVSTNAFDVWFTIYGPVAREVGLNTGASLFGPGARANVSIGRAIRLGLLNVANLKPGVVDRSCLGQANKYGTVIAEDEDSLLWGTLGEQMGIAPGASGFTMGWGQHPRLTLNSEARTPEELLNAIAEDIRTIQGFDTPTQRAPGQIELSPENLIYRERIRNHAPHIILAKGHQKILRDAGWSRRDVQEYLLQHTARSVGDARRGGYGLGPMIDLDQTDDEMILLYWPERFLIMCAGGEGNATMHTQYTIMSTGGYENGRAIIL